MDDHALAAALVTDAARLAADMRRDGTDAERKTSAADCAAWDWLPGRALVEGAGGVATIVRAHGHDWHLAGAPTAVRQAAELLGAG
ncbi:hypothetical protein [Curtobacterium sp. MCSS17_008]|uniref:hypothetical protein n=1 Tax=Curtobacterium sp. MCSS17_008 TaxID=2175647 RepID=UPI0015E87BCC|nr:hypothetical protein [Curtobacterium sp. MCSS17_008]